MDGGIAPFFAPITLIIGGILLVVGLLSFLDLHFLKTKMRERVALAIGLAFMLATETMFATSSGSGRYFAGQKSDVTDCEFDVERRFAEERQTNKPLVQTEIVGCMDRLGYDWTTEHEHCQEARIATNVFCYLPKSSFSRALVKFQMKFE